MSSDLDEIFLKGKGKLAVATPPAEDELDKALKEEEKAVAQELRSTRASEVISERRKRIALNESETNAIKGKSPAGVVENATVQVSAQSQAALLKALIDSGTDPAKANEVLKQLDQEVMAKLLMMSGSTQGSGSLVPLLLLARQPSTSVTEIVSAAKAVVDMIPKPATSTNPTIVELTEAMRNLKELSTPADLGIGEMLQELKQGQDALRDQMHAQELSHQKDLAAAEKSRMDAELAAVRQELTSLKGRNLKQEVQEAKDFMESLGFKVATGSETKTPDLEKITENIMKSRAVENVSDALGDAIRIRAGARPGAPAGGAAQSDAFACETCAQRGVRTMLRVTPEAAAGRADITCPVCGTQYGRESK